jgi:hypothetical protein
MRPSTALLVRPTALAIALFSTVATAQSEQREPPSAKTLFDLGQMFVAENRYDAACPKFEESYKLDPRMTTLYHLADCWEHTGRQASAWARFAEVADVAGRAGQKDLELSARARATALEGKLPLLVVEVKSKDLGLEISKDGAPLGSAQWGTPVPVDPGRHTIEARAPGKRPRKVVVDLPRDAQTMTVTVPPLDGESGQVARTDVAARDSKDERPSDARPSGANGTATAIGLVLGGVGVAAIAVGTVSGLTFLSKRNEAASICPTGAGCTAEELATYDDAMAAARNARKISLLGFGVGGSAIVGGVILLFAAPRSTNTGLALSPAFGAGTVFATLGGRW